MSTFSFDSLVWREDDRLWSATSRTHCDYTPEMEHATSFTDWTPVFDCRCLRSSRCVGSHRNSLTHTFTADGRRGIKRKKLSTRESDSTTGRLTPAVNNEYFRDAVYRQKFRSKIISLLYTHCFTSNAYESGINISLIFWRYFQLAPARSCVNINLDICGLGCKM